MLSTDVIAGGLDFHTTGSWTKSGNVYTDSVATDTITVGYQGSSALIQLGGTVRVDTTSTSPTFGATGNVSAIISGTTIPIVTGGVSSQSISQLIGSSGLSGLNFQPFTVAGVNFNPSSIAFNKTNNLIQLQQTIREWYSTDQVAQIVGKSEFTVREWARLGRIRAEKRRSGRGAHASWAISHAELLRLQREGLLPFQSNEGR